MFNQLPAPALLLDRSGSILKANPPALELFADDKAELTEKQLQDLVAASPETVQDLLSDTEQNQPRELITTMAEKQDGMVRLLIRTSILDDSNILALLEKGPETSQWECTKDCRRGRILETQYLNNPMGILLVNEKMEIISCNPMFLQMLKVPDHTGQCRDDSGRLQMITEQLQEPRPFQELIESLCRHPGKQSRDELALKDGRTFLTHSFPIYQRTLFLGRIWYLLDITPWKTMQQEVILQQKLQEAVFEHIQDGIVVCDDAGRLTMVNRESRRLHGCDPGRDSRRKWKEWTRKHLYLADGTTPLASSSAPLARALRGELVRNQELVFVSDDGQRRDLCINGQAMFDNQGNKLGAVISLHDITDLNRAREQLRYLAYHDLLTGLPNRRLFHDLLNQSLRQARRNKEKVAVLFLDLDNFKLVNDSYGHESGDQLLLDLSTSLRLILRDSDILCRWGGDEFILALPQIQDRDNGIMVAEKLCAFIKDHLRDKYQDCRISTSIGIALYPDHGDAADTLIRKADMAMYAAKEQGKNGCFCAPDDHSSPMPMDTPSTSPA